MKHIKKVIKFQEDSLPYFDASIAACEDGLFFNALHHIREAIRIDPRCLEYRTQLAEILYEMDLHAQVINSSLKILSLDERVAEAYFYVVRSFLAMNDEDTAIEFLRAGMNNGLMESAEIDVNEVLECFQEHRKLTLIDDDAEARSLLNLAKAMELKREFSNARSMAEFIPRESRYRADADLLQIDCYIGEQRFEEAEALARQILAERPLEPVALCAMFQILRATGRAEDAKSYLETMKDVVVTDVNVLFRYAYVMLESGDHEGGKVYLDRLLEERPYDERLLMLEGICLYNLGDTDGAIERMLALIDIDDSNILAMHYNEFFQDHPVKEVDLDYAPKLPDGRAERILKELKELFLSDDLERLDDYFAYPYRVQTLRWWIQTYGIAEENKHVFMWLCENVEVEDLYRHLTLDIYTSIVVKKAVLEVLIEYRPSTYCYYIGSEFRILDAKTPPHVKDGLLFTSWVKTFSALAGVTSKFEKELRKVFRALSEQCSAEMLAYTADEIAAAVFCWFDETLRGMEERDRNDYAEVFKVDLQRLIACLETIKIALDSVFKKAASSKKHGI